MNPIIEDRTFVLQAVGNDGTYNIGSLVILSCGELVKKASGAHTYALSHQRRVGRLAKAEPRDCLW